MEFLISLLRVCLLCCRPTSGGAHLCRACKSDVFNKFEATPEYLDDLGFWSVAPLSWSPESEYAVSKIVYSQKRGTRSQLTKYLAERCLGALGLLLTELEARDSIKNDFSSNKNVSKRLVWVPCPSRASLSRERNHATLLAQNLRELAGGGIFDVLEFDLVGEKSYVTQKTKTATERALSKMAIKCGRSLPLEGQSEEIIYVLVDDVLSTGSTAKAAYEALGRPSNFVSLTIARRERLRCAKK